MLLCYHWWWWSINKRIGRTMGKKGRNVVCQLSAAANGLAQGGRMEGRISSLCAHILCGWRTVISCNSSRAFGSGVKGRSEGKSERDRHSLFLLFATLTVYLEKQKPGSMLSVILIHVHQSNSIQSRLLLSQVNRLPLLPILLWHNWLFLDSHFPEWIFLNFVVIAY